MLAGDNVKIPIDTLIAGVYNVDCPKKLSRKYTKIGEYFAYRSPDVLPGRVLTRINPGSNVPWYSTDYAYECVARGYSLYTQTYGCVRMLSDNMRRALINNGFTHLYSYGKDINNTPADIPESLDPCINTILSTALQRSVNFREHKFFVGNEPQSFFYDFFISPDNGLIIVDHVSEYKEGLTSNFTTGRTEEHLFKLASAPVRFMSAAIVFTNKIAYKMSNTVGELKSKEKQYKLVQYIKKFARAVEDATGLYVLS